MKPIWLALTILLAACAGPARPPGSSAPVGETQTPPAPIRITAAIPATPPFLYNKLNVGGVGGQGNALQELVHVGLTGYDPRADLHPRLAEAVPSVDNGLWQVFSDGRMETTWRIRRGALWHDGAPFTSDDLVFTATAVQDRDLVVFRDIAYDSIESVHAPDPLTITVRWKRPFIQADGLFGQGLAAPLPKHLLEQSYSEHRAGFTELPYWSREFVGTGPFKVREFERNSHLLVEAFDRYVLGRPKIDQVEVKFFPDETTIVANILAGVVELTLSRSVSAEQGLLLQEQWKDGRMEVDFSEWYVMYPQHLNPSPPVTLDVRFRRALLHATNRQQMADTLLAGLSTIAHAIVSPREGEYRDVESFITRYDYDPRRAVATLDGLGYTRGADGIFRDASGQRLSVEINTTRQDAHQKLLLTLTDEWAQVGVAVDPVVIPPQRAQDAEYRATFPGFALQGHPAEIWRYHSREARLPERNYTGGNNSRYMNPEMDTLIDRYFTTVPKAERTQALTQIVRHMTEHVVVLSLIWRADPTMMAKRLHNVQAKGRQATQAWNAHEWEAR